MRFESQTHPQDDHVDRITDCSTRYDQAPVVCTRVRLAKGKWSTLAFTISGELHNIQPMVLFFVSNSSVKFFRAA